MPQALDEVWEHLLGEGLTTWLGRTTLGAVGEDYAPTTASGARCAAAPNAVASD